MKRRPTHVLLAWAVLGLLGGHHATYLAIYRDPALIEQMLDVTGHGWLSIAPLLALSALLTALVLGVRGSAPVRSFRWRFLALAAIQVVTFTLVEVGERQVVGGDLLAAMADGGWLVLGVGAAIQVGVAFLLAAASRVAERLAAALARRRTRAPRREVRSTPRPRTIRVPRSVVAGRGWAPRAPPVLA